MKERTVAGYTYPRPRVYSSPIHLTLCHSALSGPFLLPIPCAKSHMNSHLSLYPERRQSHKSPHKALYLPLYHTSPSAPLTDRQTNTIMKTFGMSGAFPFVSTIIGMDIGARKLHTVSSPLCFYSHHHSPSRHRR